MALNGRLLTIYLDGQAIAGSRATKIESKADLIEKSSPNTAEYKEYVTGDKEWKVQVNFLVSAIGDLAALLVVGNTYTLVFGPTGQTGSSKSGLQGQAILQQYDIDSSVGSLIKGNFVFQGTGILTMV